MIEHLTWSNPTGDELKQLKKAMFLKVVRLLLSSAAVFAVSVIFLFLLNLGGPDIDTRMMAAPVLVVIIIYYWHRCHMFFGRRLCLEEQIMAKTGFTYVWFVVNMCAAFIIFFAGFRIGVLQCILLAVMSVLTYWKESFMLILFVSGKYTVKDGVVTYRDDQLGFWGQGGTRVHWWSRVFVLDFDDAAGRQIPVMADWYTYHVFKKNRDAVLIRYDFRGDTGMLELVKCRKSVE